MTGAEVAILVGAVAGGLVVGYFAGFFHAEHCGRRAIQSWFIRNRGIFGDDSQGSHRTGVRAGLERPGPKSVGS